MASSKCRGKMESSFQRDNDAFCKNGINDGYLDGHVDTEVWKLCSTCA